MDILAGAYVIRNRKTSCVVTIRDAAFSSWSWVAVSEQNENELRDQQIWWIEPLPSGDSGEGVVYSITNTSSGKALGLRGGNGIEYTIDAGTYTTASPGNGAPWQKWRIKSDQLIGDETYHSIANTYKDHFLGIPKDGFQWCLSQKRMPAPRHIQQCWELVPPKVAFPCGWLQIQNSGTGALLSHTYLSNPPTLVNLPSVRSPIQCREGWHAQWTLIRAKSYAPSTSFTTGINTWFIRNRLTRGFLSNTAELGITAWEADLLYPAEGSALKNGLDVAEYTWELDLDSDRRTWNIINHKTKRPLAQVPNSNGTFEVHANMRTAQSKNWVLTSPAEGDPPPYG